MLYVVPDLPPSEFRVPPGNKGCGLNGTVSLISDFEMKNKYTDKTGGSTKLVWVGSGLSRPWVSFQACLWGCILVPGNVAIQQDGF